MNTADAARVANATRIPAEQTVKTVVLRDHDEFVVAALPACERLDLHKLRATLGRHQSLRLATEAEIADAFPGFDVGAALPLGPGADVHVVDQRLLTYNRVLCGGGDERALLDTMDLVRACDALVADICARRPAQGR